MIRPSGRVADPPLPVDLLEGELPGEGAAAADGEDAALVDGADEVGGHRDRRRPRVVTRGVVGADHRDAGLVRPRARPASRREVLAGHRVARRACWPRRR